MLTDIQEAIVPKLATWNNCYCCTVNYLKRSWGSGSICFFICFHHGIFLQLVSFNHSKEKNKHHYKPRFEITRTRLYLYLHIATRQSHQNVKAYNRNMRWGHSNVQRKKHPRRILGSPLIVYFPNSSHEKPIEI